MSCNNFSRGLFIVIYAWTISATNTSKHPLIWHSHFTVKVMYSNLLMVQHKSCLVSDKSA